MITPRHIIWAMLFPAIVAFIATFAAHRGFKRDRANYPWGPAIGIVGAFALSYYGIVGSFPSLRQHFTAQAWILVLSMAAMLVSLLASPPREPVVIVWMLSIALLLAEVWRLLQPRQAAMEAREFHTWLAALAAGFVLWWIGMETLARRRAGGGLPLLLSAATGAEAIILVNAHTQALGQIAGGIAIALLVAAIVGFWFRNLQLTRGGVLAVAITFLGLVVCGNLFADLSLPHLIIVAAAPLVLWIGEIPALRRRSLLRFIVCAILLLGVLSIALIPALKGLRETMREQQVDPYQ